MLINKVAITGHTAGIGEGLFQYYAELAVGFSRSTGYDLSKSGTVDTIINQSIDTEIFINNAYVPGAQTELAKKWFQTHQNQKHLLINISSISTIASLYMDDKYPNYTKHKTELDKISWDINFSNYPAKCINISPGVVDTKMAHPDYANKFKSRNTLITVEEIVMLIVENIDQYFKNPRWFVPHLYIINNTDFL